MSTWKQFSKGKSSLKYPGQRLSIKINSSIHVYIVPWVPEAFLARPLANRFSASYRMRFPDKFFLYFTVVESSYRKLLSQGVFVWSVCVCLSVEKSKAKNCWRLCPALSDVRLRSTSHYWKWGYWIKPNYCIVASRTPRTFTSPTKWGGVLWSNHKEYS